MQIINFKAFTLVELIVVITIVWILSTVGFVSYSGYLTWARDSNRISQLTKLSDSLQTYAASKSLPLPDDAISISLSWSSDIISYQWYAWVDVLETIDYTNWGKDPKDDSYFVYYLTKDRKKLQLLTYLEDGFAWNFSPIWSETYAIDYQDRFPKWYWSELWLLLSAEEETVNTPIQEVITDGFLDVFNSSELIRPYFSDREQQVSYSWYTLWAFLSTRLGWPRPWDCPIWFVWVRWNLEYSENGFCVAQYEMTYSDADTPNSVTPWTRNTVWYEENKVPVSMPWKYPISMITWIEARAACESMWKWFHLITNDEWMTVARSIETNPVNWSSWEIGNGFIYSWLTADVNHGCNNWPLWGNTEPRAQVAKTWEWDIQECNEKRSQLLDNWKEVWDLWWNLFERIDKGDNYESFFSLPTASAEVGNWDSDGVYDLSDMRRVGSLFGLWTAAWMWSVNFPAWRENNSFMRWWFVNQPEQSGLYTLFLWWYETESSDVSWFRCTRYY